MSQALTVILAAGGTGGHVFPALAAADALKARGHRPILATDARGGRYEGGVETAHVPAAGLGGGVAGKLKGGLTILKGVFAARSLIRREGADVVVGFGGFPSLPTMLAARLTDRPTILHEQNAVLGRANRLLAGGARRIATAFPAVRFADPAKCDLTGNPVRAAIAAVGDVAYAPPEADQPIHLLIFGGSQGARVLSDVVPAALGRLPESMRSRLRVVQQCRPEDLARVTAAYAEAGLEAETASFFDDMPARLAAAHLVIARAGASTVAELAAAGRPSLLIPYAAAMDDHQTANAEALVQTGAARRIAEKDAAPDAMANEIATLLADPASLTEAAAAARAGARTDAADALANLIETTAMGTTTRAAAPIARGIAA